MLREPIPHGFLAGDRLRQFLASRLPRPVDVPPDRDLFDVIESHTGRKIVWVRPPDVPPTSDLEAERAKGSFPYRRYFTDPHDAPRLGEALQRTLNWLNSYGYNSPQHAEHSYRSYVLVQDEYLVFVGLPHERITMDPSLFGPATKPALVE